MTRLLITGDLHIDEYLSRRDAATGMNARLVDHLTTLRWVAQLARDRECDALVVAGDFTERKHVNEWLIRLIQDALSDGPKRQIFIRGNHDSLTAHNSIVDVLAEMGPGWTGHNTTGLDVVGDVVICSISYMDRHHLRTQPGFEDVPEAEIFAVLAEQFLVIARGLYAEAISRWPDATPILVCHQALAGGQMSEQQAAFLGDLALVIDAHALASIGFGAVVAGHFHRAQLVVDDPRCPVLYCGAIERTDFGEEGEEKSVVILEVVDSAVTFERIPTPARRYVTLRGGVDDQDKLEAIAGCIVRAVDLDPDIDTAALRAALEAAGAFEVMDLKHRAVDGPAVVGGLSEALTPHQALAAYFEGETDAEALIERGREILAEVGS